MCECDYNIRESAEPANTWSNKYLFIVASLSSLRNVHCDLHSEENVMFDDVYFSSSVCYCDGV